MESETNINEIYLQIIFEFLFDYLSWSSLAIIFSAERQFSFDSYPSTCHYYANL